MAGPRCSAPRRLELKVEAADTGAVDLYRRLGMRVVEQLKI